MHSDVQADQPAANMKTVTVTVSWNYRAMPRTYTLRTIYTDFSGSAQHGVGAREAMSASRSSRCCPW